MTETRSTRLTCIDSVAALQPHHDAWNALVLQAAEPNVFLTFEWVEAWWVTYGGGDSLRVLLVADAEGLIGIAPLYLTTAAGFAGIGVRELRLLGGRHVGGDFLDLIHAVDREPEVCDAVWGWLREHRQEWDRIVLSNMDTRSATIPVLQSRARRSRYPTCCLPMHRCPSVALPESIEAFLALPDHGFKASANRHMKKVCKRHDVQVELQHTGDLNAALERLFLLHAERWSLEGRSGSMHQQAIQTFFKRVSPKLARQDWLRLSSLSVDGEVEAMQYGLRLGGAHFFLQAGCGTAGRKLRAGSALQWLVIADLIGDAHTFHFLRGEERYKYLWGGVDRLTEDLFISRSLRGAALSVWQAGVKQLKECLRRRLRPCRDWNWQHRRRE